MRAVEPYRPRLHLSPKAGWINDPNGLIRVDGVWHVFYQHHPFSTLWGPMHWGHASSPDLVTWTQHGVALEPDTLGTCFSGSAIETPEGGIKLFYTAHRKQADGSDFQVQCLVHADRELTTFSSDTSNPVVPNPGLTVFRDPKVFRYADTDRWIMVLTHGQSVGIYSSEDLVDWQYESTFGEGHGRHSDGPWECPDLLPLTAPDGSQHWVLVVGIASGGYAPGSGTQYFVGSFDGRTFTNVNHASTELWLDHGRDFYAAQTFFGVENGPPIALGWASNWLYARETPTRQFRGVISLPRQLRLVECGAGLRLACSIPPDVAAAFDHFRLADTPLVPRTGTFRLSGTVRLAPGQAAFLALFGEPPQFELSRSTEGVTVLRVRRQAREGIPQFEHDYEVGLGHSGEIEVDIFVDNGLVEICLDRGTTWVTSLYFPADTAGRIQIDRVGKVEELPA